MEDKTEMSHSAPKREHDLKMVDVSEKDITLWRACAQGCIRLSKAAIKKIIEGTLPKGDVLSAARIAGINAAKKTSELIPLCHQLPLNAVNVSLAVEQDRITISSEVTCHGRTGVEIEALTAVAAAALTIYDMSKSIDKNMRITDIVLIEKSGGRSGHYLRDDGGQSPKTAGEKP